MRGRLHVPTKIDRDLMNSTISPRLAALFRSALVLSLSACGGGSGSSAGGGPNPTPGTPPSPSPPATTLNLAACAPSGLGTDYQVGDGKAYTALEQVPWENLGPGDTVRIFYRAAPYAGKFLIAAQGTSAAPVRICGVRGPNNERPIIDGNGAVTRAELRDGYSQDPRYRPIHEARSVIVIKPLATQAYEAYPSYIQIDGLNIKRAHPSYTFRDTAGATERYGYFGSCIWIDRGHHILIADNEISDCSQGIFSKSTDDGDFAVSKDLRIAGNYLWGNGIVPDANDDGFHNHSSYTQSVGTVIEFNHYGPLRAGALGNPIKDRSVGTVVRYNRIDEGAHSIDLVEAEDFPITATTNPAYRTTFVYGNQIKKSGDTGSFIHYGGDHFGSAPGNSWGEPIFRKGTLFFFNNTVYATGRGAELFQVDTTEERVEVWNNIFVFDVSAPIGLRSMRAKRDGNPPWTPGGIVNLGRNWISEGWADSDIDHPVQGQLLGSANMLSGSTPPIDLLSMTPIAGSIILDKNQAPPSGASAWTVDYQLGPAYVPMARTVTGSSLDLGAVER